MTNRDVAFFSILISYCIVLNIVENVFIPFIIFPWVKIGLANIFIIFIILNFSLKKAIFANVLRILVASLISGNISVNLLLSLSGNLVSTIVMFIILNKLKKYFSIEVTSVIGSISSNLVQFSVAYFLIIKHSAIFTMMIYTIFLSLVTGYAIGFIAKNVQIYYNTYHFKSYGSKSTNN